ncbi:hypothetical protein CDL12_05433 [Handroanthus impetiginosus]|uniref:Wall-associated receptor kinase galacturonan-binding domain-containing protein n=1 Tax=Handroanthus impetiginosus TaxID=429701 RepID=A0A2G9HWH0_9LAMI|nr:hypothetical protein CDL12_05433 [Handroanthus impetiginosus]
MAIVLLFFTLLSLTNALPPNECPKCGTMEVPYPLSTSQTCGNPNYKLICNNGILQFPSADNLVYKILSINPTTMTLIIEPSHINQNNCQSSDLGSNGFRIDETSPFNISKRNTVMLFNCSNNILLSPLNCSSTSPCRQFEDQAYGCENTLCCSYLKDSSMTSHRIRIRAGGCSAYTSVVDLKPKESVDAWNFGIELQWMPPN